MRCLWLLPAVQAIFTEDLGATWLWQGVGRISHATVQGNDSFVISSAALARIDSQGRVVWKQQVFDAENLQSSDKYVYIQRQSTLEAFDPDTGAKEWSYPNVDSYAVDGDLIAIERNGKWAHIDHEFSELNGKHIYSCDGRLAFEPCPSAAQISASEFGETTLTVDGRKLWTRHEGLTRPVAACVVAPERAAPIDSSASWLANWRARVERHTRMGLFAHTAPDNQGLLVVLTDPGSLYALHTSNGSVAWAVHDKLSGSLESNGSTVVVNGDTKRVYSFYGELLAELPPDSDANHILVKGSTVRGPSWEHKTENLLAVLLRSNHETASPGVPAAGKGKDFFYKYINPDLVAIVTTSGIELVDGSSGSVLARETIGEISACEIGEFWVAFLAAGQLHVWYLFESDVPNTRSEGVYIKKTQLDGESFVNIAVSRSKHGVTEQCILATDAAGRVLALPHSFLQRQRTAGTLPHQFVLSHDLKIDAYMLVAETLHYESSYAVAALGTDIFCCEFSPSGPFDRLKNFNRTPVMVSLAIVTYVTYQLARTYRQDKLALEWA